MSIVPTIPGFSDFERLNAGGSGVVYSARDERHRRMVAVKVMVAKTLDPTIRESFIRELNAMGQLSDHPHIVSVYESGFTEGDDLPYLVMPLYTNGSYATKLASDGPLPWPDLVDMGIKVLSALETTHQRSVLHRDIKPDNIFVGSYRTYPILGDFGISTLTNSGKTATKATGYTLLYAAPEVIDGARQTRQSDIYSLGVTFHTLLSGTAPFEAATNSAILARIISATSDPLPASVPIALAEIIGRMMHRDPNGRPHSCREIAEQLQTLQDHPTPLLIDGSSSAPANKQQTVASATNVASSPRRSTNFQSTVTHAEFDQASFSSSEPEVPAANHLRIGSQSRWRARSWALWTLPLAGIVGVLVLFFAFNAYTNDNGTEESDSTSPPLGGGIQVGDCVDITTGPDLVERPCTATADSRVVGSTTASDGQCPDETTNQVTLPDGLVACLGPVISAGE